MHTSVYHFFPLEVDNIFLLGSFVADLSVCNTQNNLEVHNYSLNNIAVTVGNILLLLIILIKVFQYRLAIQANNATQNKEEID